MNIIIKILSLLSGVIIAFFYGMKSQKIKNNAKETNNYKNIDETLNKMDIAGNNIQNDKKSIINTLDKGKF